MMCCIDVSPDLCSPLSKYELILCGALVSDFSLVLQERPESDTISNNGSVPKNL